MKKFLAMLLAATMVVGLVGCGGSGDSAESSAPASSPLLKAWIIVFS